MVRILIVGGAGFIGRHVAGRLRDRDHNVVAASRAEIDLSRDDQAELLRKVKGFEVVVNCAGLARDRKDATMQKVHGEGASTLFRACLAAGVRRVIHVSALGVRPDGATNYQRTKSAAEDCLAALDPGGERIDWCVLRPSLVVGRGGASVQLELALAVLPLLPRMGSPDWRFQPVDIDDLTELVARFVARDTAMPRKVDVVGPTPMNTDALLVLLREWLGLPPTRFVTMPKPLLVLAARIGGMLPDSPFHPEILTLLALGNTADVGPLTKPLGRPPRAVEQALALTPACAADRMAARLYFLRPLLRWAIGLLWIATGLLSFGIYPVEKSYAMLAEIGLKGEIANFVLYGGAATDLILGVLLLVRWRLVAVGVAQLATMAMFTILAAGLSADYWLHPFAPLLKNLPIAAAVLVMIALEA
jgi:uncharacterized protein YbjT (DUF2867 family)